MQSSVELTPIVSQILLIHDMGPPMNAKAPEEAGIQSIR